MKTDAVHIYNLNSKYQNPAYCQATKKVQNITPFCSGYRGLEIGSTGIKRILTEAEYDKVLAKLKASGAWDGRWDHSTASKFDEGVMPYAGTDDISHIINTFLREGRVVSDRYTTELIREHVRLLDYALSELDKTYGKYEGFVFRNGPVDKIGRNYISTSRTALGAVNASNSRRAYEDQYYIIMTQNGHKIEEVQKKLKYNPVYIAESEILLEPSSFYDEILTETPEIKAAKEELLKALNQECHYVSKFMMKVKVLKEYY